MTAMTITRNLLLAFVLISSGFAVGREVGLSKADTRAKPTANSPHERADTVVVYYMHRTFRCVTCNRIEKMAQDVVQREFAEQLSRKTVQWKQVNFEVNEDLARRYNVASSSVVVVQLRDGREVAHQTLDEVWTLVNKPAEFATYIGDAVRQYTSGGVK